MNDKTEDQGEQAASIYKDVSDAISEIEEHHAVKQSWSRTAVPIALSLCRFGFGLLALVAIRTQRSVIEQRAMHDTLRELNGTAQDIYQLLRDRGQR